AVHGRRRIARTHAHALSRRCESARPPGRSGHGIPGDPFRSRRPPMVVHDLPTHTMKALRPAPATLRRHRHGVRPPSTNHNVIAPENLVALRPNEDRQKSRFSIALLLSTWVPLVFFSVHGRLSTVTGVVVGVRTILVFVGTAHVAATFFLYTDRDFFFGISHANPHRYLYVPV